MKNEQKTFQSLRGFLAGEETEEEKQFAYSATLRIFGENLDFDDIEANLGVSPTHSHLKVERIGSKKLPSFKHDMWQYNPNLDENIELEQHIDALWATIRHAKEYIISLKEVATVDVFLGYRSNVDTAVVVVPHTCLEMFVELEIPFGLSIVIA